MRNHLKAARSQKGLTQSDLAEKARVSRQTIFAIEKGNYIPSALLALKLAALLQIQVEELFELEDGD